MSSSGTASLYFKELHQSTVQKLFTMNKLKHQPVLVLGAGLSGIAAARLAARKGARVFLFDEAPTEKLAEHFAPLSAIGISCYADWEATRWDCPFLPALAIISPGIKPGSKLGQLAANLPCPILSELAFGAGYCKCPLLAVTGSNGKTTTVEMLTMCLNAAGAKAIAGGNIGLPLSQLALQSHRWDYIIVEVSSFQLEHADGFQPAAAALLNITPDHLDRHGTFESYRNLKLKLLQQTRKNTPLVLKAELLRDRVIAGTLKKRPLITFSAEPGQLARYTCSETAIGRSTTDGFHPLLDFQKLAFSGRHNFENAMCVMALLEQLPIDQEKALHALSQFNCGHHRLEKIAEISGVTYVNDSKATNVDAMIKALEYCGNTKTRKIILIAGGVDKGCELDEAKNSLKMYVKQVLLIGECRQRLAEAWREAVPVLECPDFNSAMTAAVAKAREGDTVLLSPGCASFDMFRDYGHRGQSFVQFVENLKKESEK